MGKVTGFLEIARKKPPTRPVAERLHDWREVYLPYPEEGLKDQAARCMDCGDPLLPYGLSAREPDPRLERPRVPGSLARRHRSAARDEQLSGVHRPPLPGAVRGRVRPRHQQRRGDDQGRRGLDHRPRLRRGVGGGAAARSPHRPARRGRRVGAGRARGGGPAEPRRPCRHGLRARRTASAGCCATASPSSSSRSGSSIGGCSC